MMYMWHCTHHFLESARPDKGLFTCHGVEMGWYLLVWVIKSLAFWVDMVSQVESVDRFLNQFPSFIEWFWKWEI